MSFQDLKKAADADSAFAERLADCENIDQLQALAKEKGIELDPEDLAGSSQADGGELSDDALEQVSGGMRVLTPKIGFNFLRGGKITAGASADSDSCETWDLDKCTVDTDSGAGNDNSTCS